MEFLANYLKGIVLGIANIIPGISAGTMALIMGIYTRLTGSIGEVFTKKEKRMENVRFLLVIVLGVGTGIIAFTHIFSWLLAVPMYAQLTYFTIAGFILGSIPYIVKLNSGGRPTAKRVLILLVAFAFVILISMLGESKEVVYQTAQNSDLWLGVFNIGEFDMAYNVWIALCGFLGGGSMILPGISGSAVMVSMGEYSNILQMIKLRLIIPLSFLGIGAFLGFVGFAKLISYLLKKHAANTFYAILGLVLASVFQVFAKMENPINFSFYVFVPSIILLVGGFFGSYYVGRVKSGK